MFIPKFPPDGVSAQVLHKAHWAVRSGTGKWMGRDGTTPWKDAAEGSRNGQENRSGHDSDLHLEEEKGKGLEFLGRLSNADPAVPGNPMGSCGAKITVMVNSKCQFS